MKWFELYRFLKDAIRQRLIGAVRIISVPIILRIKFCRRDLERGSASVERLSRAHRLLPGDIAPLDFKGLSVAVKCAAARALDGVRGATNLEYVTMLCILMVGLIPAAGIVGAHSDGSLATLEEGFGGSSETSNPGGMEAPVSAAPPPGLTDATDPGLIQSGPKDRARELLGGAPGRLLPQ